MNKQSTHRKSVPTRRPASRRTDAASRAPLHGLGKALLLTLVTATVTLAAATLGPSK